MAAFSRLLFRSIRSFIRNQTAVFAASISYYTIMAIVPFFLFLLTVIGFVLGENPKLKEFIVSKFLETFPDATREITFEISKLVSYSGIGIASFMAFAYLSFRLFKSAEYALNTIFRLPRSRALHSSIIVSIIIMSFIILLFIASFGASTVLSSPVFMQRHLPGVKISAINGLLIRYIVPLALMWLIITLLYIILPMKKPPIFASLKSGFLVTIMLEIAKHLFTWYTAHIAGLGYIYGPLTAFIFFLLWIYYSSCLFLLGAEIISNRKK